MRLHTGVYGRRRRICTENWRWEKITCRTGESNLYQRIAGPMLYHLSYIPTLDHKSLSPPLSILLLLLFKKKKFLWFFIVIVVIVITIRNHHCHFSLLLPVELDTSVLSASSTTVSPSRHPSLSLCPFDGVRLCFSFLCPSVSVSLALSLFVRLSPSVYVSLFFSRLFFSAPSPQPHQLNWVLS